MNPSINYILASDQVLVDEKGKISVIGVFEKIKSENAPAFHPRFSIIANLAGPKNTSYEFSVDIINTTDNLPIASAKSKFEFKEGGANLIVDFVNVLFPSFGRFPIKIVVDGKVVSDPAKHYVILEKS